MVIMKVTPTRNVIISKSRVKSENIENFFSKIIPEGSTVAVYDVTDRKCKLISISEISNRKHRIIINDKKFFICSIVKAN